MGSGGVLWLAADRRDLKPWAWGGDRSLSFSEECLPLNSFFFKSQFSILN